MLGLGKSLLRPDYVVPFIDPSSWAGLVTWYDASDALSLYTDNTTTVVWSDIANGSDNTGSELYKITNKWNATWVDVGGNSSANGPYFGSELRTYGTTGDKPRIRSAIVFDEGVGLSSNRYWFIHIQGPTAVGGGNYSQNYLGTSGGGTIDYSNMTVFLVLSHLDGDADPTGEQIFLDAWGRNGSSANSDSADARAWRISTSGSIDKYFLKHYEGHGGLTPRTVVNTMTHSTANTEDGSNYNREMCGVLLYANAKSYSGSSNAGTSIMTVRQMQGISEVNGVERYPNLADDGQNQVAYSGCGMRIGASSACGGTPANQGANTGFKGRFHELIIYERSLADWEVGSVLSYLDAKWAHIRL